jgi:hypothetical protein
VPGTTGMPDQTHVEHIVVLLPPQVATMPGVLNIYDVGAVLVRFMG